MNLEMQKQKVLEKVKNELKLRNYSRRTIKAYISDLEIYFAYREKHLKLDRIESAKNFLIEQLEKKAPKTVNQYHNAINFLYREILKVPEIHLKYAKTTKNIPFVLTRLEIQKIIASISNSKHKLAISLAYSAGLRISEVINLKVKDLNLEELTIHIKAAKGKKDRITIISEKLKVDLRNLVAGKSMNDYVFASNRGGKLNERSLQKVFEIALKKTK
jgi:integrase/recombinase XerD